MTIRNSLIRTALLAGALLLLLGIAAVPAQAKAPCWKTLINDWYDGRIDGTYPIPCYRAALQHLPSDVEAYSSARDDIKQALQKRITQGVNPGTTPGTSTPGSTNNTDTNGDDNPGTGIPGNPGNDGPGNPGSEGDEPGPGRDATGVIPGAGSPDSVPIPLIVLGSIAALLMAAGAAGFIARRGRTKRLQLASAAAVTRGASKPPPPPE